jgi:1-acyl-sn-glycerol-3-phosphate acyltransferase
MVDYAVLRKTFRMLLYCNGIRCEVHFPEGEDESCLRAAPIIVSNHISYVDGFCMAAEINMPRILAMTSVRNMPVVGKLASDIDCIFVDRDKKDSRRAAMDAINAHVDAWIPGSRAVLLFPEGTCSNGESLFPFSKGAFVPGKPVRPLVLHYGGWWTPANVNAKTNPETGDTEKFDDQQWARTFMASHRIQLAVHVLPVYTPSEAERNDPQLFAANVHEVMAAKLAELYAQEPAQRPSNNLIGPAVEEAMAAMTWDRMQRDNKAPQEEEARTRLRASLGLRGGFSSSREGAQDRVATLRDQGDALKGWVPNLRRMQLPLGMPAAPRSERAMRAEQQRL